METRIEINVFGERASYTSDNVHVGRSVLVRRSV